MAGKAAELVFVQYQADLVGIAALDVPELTHDSLLKLGRRIRLVFACVGNLQCRP
jgi:hypothetical protein